QLSMFVGIMRRTTSQIRDVQEADLWVTDPMVRFVDEIKPLPDPDLHRVRGVPGVAWAVPFFKGLVQARLDEGSFRRVIALGVDDASLMGRPRGMLLGELADLRKPDAAVVDLAGFHLLWPGEPLRLGKVVEMNNHRAVLVGVCSASAPFQTGPVVYT